MRDELKRVLDDFQAHTWPALPGRTNHLEAGVLVPVVLDESPRILAILRSAELRQHAGEVAFPGGKPESHDADIQATAIREAQEELGLSRVDILGRLSSMPLYTSDYRLEPFIGAVTDESLIPDPGEVAQVFRLDVHDWLSRDGWEGVPFDMHGGNWVSPVFVVEGHLMYGGTAHVLHEAFAVIARALGRPLPPLNRRSFTSDDILERAFRSA